MPKIVNTALKAKAKAKAWTFEVKAKAKATGPEAKAKAIKFGLEAPRGQGLASRTTSLLSTMKINVRHSIEQRTI